VGLVAVPGAWWLVAVPGSWWLCLVPGACAVATMPLLQFCFRMVVAPVV